MADIVEELRLVLVANDSVEALVAQRIYQDRLPQGMTTMPAIALEEVTGVDAQELSGEVVSRQTRVRAKAYALTPTAAVSVRNAVETALAPLRGTTGGQFINDVTLAGRGNGGDPPIDGSDVWRVFKFQDFKVVHRE